MANTVTVMRPELTPLPVRMMHLPVDARGFPIPWFVATLANGEPEFRAMDAHKWMQAVRHKLCWVCGTRLGAHLAFVTGPMCLINLTNSEPPSHLQCATWSAINCPFLSRPHMVRREGGLPDEVEENVAGIGIRRNPGAVAVYVVQGYRVFKDHAGKPLIQMPEEHTAIAWYAEGRKATRVEVQHSINTGLPILMALAEQDGPEAVKELMDRRKRVERWLPE